MRHGMAVGVIGRGAINQYLIGRLGGFCRAAEGRTRLRLKHESYGKCGMWYVDMGRVFSVSSYRQVDRKHFR